ncbi:MAG: pyruvate kinase [Bacteroidales bacterium]|nr:pyruvate kinase [Bacteroidales bacterium]
MEQKKTKIICTISDINCGVEFIRGLYEGGMNVARINSAHATIEGAQMVVDNIRAVSDRIGILIDTKGPEVRLTAMNSSVGFVAKQGDLIEIGNDTEGLCAPGLLHTTCKTFVDDVPVGACILVDDGSVELTVIGKENGRLQCQVQNSGVIKGKKSINVPGVHISLPALTEKDREFLEWAINADIDFIAHSFVRNKEDLLEIQEVLDRRKSHLKIISKIENQQGIDNLDEILSHCYGVMIARGDLGVEIPAEKIPLIQKRIIQRCRVRKKPVIVATQMLHSMIENPRPTRAEVSDVANAILQCTDAIMLSGETASGKYPQEAVRTMSRIAIETEESLQTPPALSFENVTKPIAAVLAKSIVEAALSLPVKAIILDTWSGRTGRYLAEFRPKVPIYAMCYRGFTMRELALTYDIYGYPFDVTGTKEGFVTNALKILMEDGKIEKGDLVGFIGGSFNDELGASYMEFKYV